jgi:osmotically inducible protein OsmC
MPERHRNPRNKVLVDSLLSSESSMMNLIIRKAHVRWKGGNKGGSRAVTTESGVLKQAKFSLGIMRKKVSDTDPAELIAAAHASSFSLALSNELGLSASAAGEVLITATVAMEHLAAGWTIMNVHLNVVAKLPKMTQNKFIDASVRAKTSCLVSRLLRANISMNAKLEK